MRVCLCRRWPVCLADAGALPVCLADAGAREGWQFLPGIRTYRAPSERGNQHETERSGNGSGAVGGAKKIPPVFDGYPNVYLSGPNRPRAYDGARMRGEAVESVAVRGNAIHCAAQHPAVIEECELP